MDHVLLARMLFGTSMAFHIIFATLTVGLSLMIFFAEWMRALRNDLDYAVLAKRLTKGLAILLGVAIPTGTIVAIMLSLLWPGFMEIVGQVIALPFQIEIFAFFLESLFLAIYVYAADRLSPAMRIISSFFIAFGAVASAVLITSAHSWMNTPRGFDIIDGQIENVNPLAAALSPSFWSTSYHVVSTAYMTGAFVLCAVAAFKLLKPSITAAEIRYHQKGLMLALVFGFLMSVWTGFTGHDTTVMLYEEIPIKLAAAEGLFDTQTNAPLTILGTPSPEANEVIGGLEFPGLLSWLATGSTDGVVQGLNDFPVEQWPPLFVHTLFNVMVGIGFALIAVSGLGLLFSFFRRKQDGIRFPKWLLIALVAAGPLAMIGIETGWIFSCTGRQPWIIFGVQTTAEAATTSGNLGLLFFLFSTLYLVLLILTSFVMYFYFKRNPLRQDMSAFR
ncbi:cytochrome ubiquinol oxidase subunit I [Shouchella clausii]|jgi:cytochrome bd ubiquinol oxidase subunit I|uniref:cytochrome ubiquinol oxidase subunit I n=2 Tax=Shouchella clausii TaxID=79880 RepID=UPI000B975B92|nr:cytochrome ubiquinol oxidase subunit I [Shouchella clausii]AST98416.1 cytochrome ubiquinol oxidase subunit I [Shouchella clausii]MBU8597891.1 cytochrome ubiquinol oxidase subunit I [Shouchella clausii]MCM3548188.1 cytochrome ubiquinol oxidase subunit I [Shouchella clausii]MCR1287752.1 cytochrome ubiquinol oxidase subunit I [Shouchella clausii]MEB5472924.1 cytochrome ubiquinol oxidase subunit I [Shouchella clausii]